MPWNRKSWLAVMATAVVLVLCLLPKAWLGPEDDVDFLPHSDKLVHFGMFFGFAFFWSRSIQPDRFPAARFWLILTAVILLAGGTEWAQGLPIVDRDPDFFDAAADTIGGLFGLFADELRRAALPTATAPHGRIVRSN